MRDLKPSLEKWSARSFMDSGKFPKRYFPKQKLGSGISGEVFLAQDRDTGRDVALKWFFPHAELATEFHGEVQSLSKLSHPGIVSLVDHGTCSGRPYLVFEYVRGISLRDYILRSAPPPLRDMKYLGNLLLQLLGVLDHLHTAGLIHRDLKPANVYLEYTCSSEGTGGNGEAGICEPLFLRPKLIDFGFARNRDVPGEEEKQFSGTLGYCAPEQLQSFALADERSDLFSFGVILYESLTGKLPYGGLNELLGKTPRPQARELNRAVPSALNDLVDQLIVRNPLKRPVSASETAQRLEKALYPEKLEFSPGKWHEALKASPPAPLSADSLLEALTRSVYPPTPPLPGFVDHLLTKTGGLPDITSEYLSFMHETGNLARRYGELTYKEPPFVPAEWLEKHEEVFSSHIRELAASQSELLSAASCLDNFTAREAAYVVGKPVKATTELLWALTRRHILKHREGRWCFQAELIRDRISASLPAGLYRRLHHKCCHARSPGSSPEVLARHLQNAGRAREAFVQYFRSARFNRQKGRTQAAVSMVEKALTLQSKLTGKEAVETTEILLAGGRPQEALSTLQRVQEEFETRRRAAPPLPFVLSRGRAEVRCGEFEAALNSFSQAIERLRENGRKTQLVEAYSGLGSAASYLGRLETARGAYENMADLAVELGDQRARTDALHGIALVAKAEGKFERAESSLRQALHAAQQLGESNRSAVVLNNLGNVLGWLGKHEEASACFRNAISTRRKLGDSHGMAITYNNLAKEQFYRGDIKSSLESIGESYRFFLSAGDLKGQATALANRGRFLTFLGKLNEALGALKRASSLAERIGDRRLRNEAELDSAEIILLRDELKAKELLQRFLSLENVTKRLSARAFLGLATASRKEEAFEEALKSAEKALELLQADQQDDEAQAEAYATKAEILLAAGRTEEALEGAQKAYELLPPRTSPLVRGRVVRVLGEAWCEMGPMWADRTEKHLEEAETVFSATGYLYELARTYLAWAFYLYYAGDLTESINKAKQAKEIFSRMKATWDTNYTEQFIREVS